MAGRLKQLLCQKRRREELCPPTTEPTPERAVVCRTVAPAVAVVCRGVRFETTLATLCRLGPCYLSTQAEIDTLEPIYLDYSAESFHVLLDALTVAQLDLGRALLHVARSRASVIDLDALLEFVLLGWVLGMSLPMPPPPAVETPRGDKFGEFRNGFNLRAAYQGDSGVFHYLLSLASNAGIDCRYDLCAAPTVLLDASEEYEDTLDAPRLGCIPVSLEVDTLMLKRRADWTDEFEVWARVCARVSSIRMLQVSLYDSANVYGDIITMSAGSAAVFDLGSRRELICEGIVIGMNRTIANKPGAHHDILTVDMASDLDHVNRTTRLACQPLEFDGDLITYFRLSFSESARRLGRVFRLRVDPFHPKVGDYFMHEHLSAPLYMLRSVELFGTLLEVPTELCAADRLREPFTMEPGVTRIKTARKVRRRLS